MENFHNHLRKITDRNELKKLKGGGGGGTPAPPTGTGGEPSSSVKCCTDVSYSNCSQCVTLNVGSSHCTGGNILVNC